MKKEPSNEKMLTIFLNYCEHSGGQSVEHEPTFLCRVDCNVNVQSHTLGQ